MKRNKQKSAIMIGLLVLSMSLSGCSFLQMYDALSNAQNRISSTEETELTSDSQTTTDGTSDNTSPNQDTAPTDTVDIEALAAECIYNVYWYTQDDEFSAGTSFLLDSDVHGEKLLVSAFHYLWPTDASSFTGAELPEYVLGGEIYNAYTDEVTGASLKSCLIIEDADAVPVINKDVSAFTIQNGDALPTLPLSTHETKPGDTIYLLANLWDTEEIHENCVYEATVTQCSDGVLYYELDEKFGTSGASGAPIVNEYGEVVAIHMASTGSIRAAHMTESFMEQINNASISDITYPNASSSYQDEQADIPDDLPTYTFNREEMIETTFFQLQIDAVTLADTLQSVPATEGYQYVILDVSLNAFDSTPVDMYYSDFVLLWDDNYCLPLETGYTENQLPDEYLITDEITTGQLVFEAPLNCDSVTFNYLDYYCYDYSDEIYYEGYFDITIPLENWARDAKPML